MWCQYQNNHIRTEAIAFAAHMVSLMIVFVVTNFAIKSINAVLSPRQLMTWRSHILSLKTSQISEKK